MATDIKPLGPDPRQSYTYRELPIGSTSIGISDDLMKTGTWRTAIRPEFKLKTPPCSEGCPAGVDVRGFIALAKEGRIREAHALYLEEHPFPAICGRVCFHPCETSCNRKEFDQAVSINALERFVADSESPAVQSAAPTGKRVAVIGSGPAGMASAYYLARLGHTVAVFESLQVLGGLLRTGIPDYRLPRSIVEKEIEKLKAMGIQFRTGHRIDRGSWRVVEGFDAAVLAIGASRQIPAPFQLSGVEDRRIFSGLDFLRRVKLGEPVSLGRKVVIIGGGNTAVDAARVALRLGASPEIIYRRSEAEMPAFHEEIEDALEEGVEIRFLISPIGVDRGESGVRVKCVANRLTAPDSRGRAGVIPVAGSEFFIDADSIVSAIGETPDLALLPPEAATSGQSIKVGPLGSTSMPALFACGDVAGGDRTVVHAVGSAKKTAAAVDRFLNKRPFDGLETDLRIGEKGGVSFRRYAQGAIVGQPDEVVRFSDLNTDYFAHKDRQTKPKTPKEQRAGMIEVRGTLSAGEAAAEAGRCFSCGLCDACENCYLFCPDSSVVKQENGAPRAFDYEYCKGCGICAQECPVGLIDMAKER